MKKINQHLELKNLIKFLKQNNFIIFLNKKLYNRKKLIKSKLNRSFLNKIITISNNQLIYKLIFKNFSINFLIFDYIAPRNFLITDFLKIQIYNKFYFNCSIKHLFSFNYLLNNKLIYKFLSIYIKFFFKTK